MNQALQKLVLSQKAPYSREFLYKVGLFHKNEVPLGERDWNELASELGLEKTGEQYRSWVNYRQRAEGSQPLQFETEESAVTIEQLQKERIKLRDAVTSYRRYLREDARLEVLIDCIKDAANRIKLPSVSYKGGPAAQTEAILLYSDLHLGVECHNFYNTYNLQVAQKRVAKVVADTLRYCRANKVARLTILNLGDLIHGHIHTDSRIEQEQDVIDQVIAASRITAQALSDLQAAAPEVIYRSCSDNHSRTTANKVESIASENFGRLIDFYLKEALKNTSIKFAEDNLDYGIGRFSLLNGKVCVFAHGHEDVLNQVWQNYIGAAKEFIDYIFVGHFHNSKLKSFQGTKVIVNGSLVGTEQYALSKRLFGTAEQTLLIFDGENTLQHILNVQEVE